MYSFNINLATFMVDTIKLGLYYLYTELLVVSGMEGNEHRVQPAQQQVSVEPFGVGEDLHCRNNKDRKP